MDVAEENLFSYGTLQDEPVQLATFGRTLAGQPAVLQGYRIGYVPIRNTLLFASKDKYHLNAEFTGLDSDSISGTVFQVTTKEIEKADLYEATANYKRILVELTSGTEAWVYVSEEN